jgi:hypothetical protein
MLSFPPYVHGGITKRKARSNADLINHVSNPLIARFLAQVGTFRTLLPMAFREGLP